MSAEPDGRPVGADVTARAAHPAIRRSRLTALALGLTLLTAGCAAGQIAQTADEKSVIDGSDASVKMIDLRAVAIAPPPSLRPSYPAGSDAALNLVLVNNSRADDTLTSIRTSAAGDWSYFADYNKAFTVQQAALDKLSGSVAPSASVSSTASASPSSDSPSGATSGSESAGDSVSGSSSSSDSSPSSSASASASATSLPTGTQSVTVPVGGRVSFGTPDATGALLLTDLTRALYPGSTVKITFTFAKAGPVTVAVPVQLSDSARTAVVSGGGESDSG